MAKIEVLFPEICNLYGNMYNIKYLQKCSGDIEIIYTALTEEPKFISEEIDMIYMAPMTEKSQEIVIKKLKPYTNRIKELINNNKLFFIIGNAVEIFSNYIKNEDGSKIKGLGIIDMYAKRDMLNRHNSLFLGEFEEIKIVGFKSQFSMLYGDNKSCYLFKVNKGIGINKTTNLEGIKINNFIGTYLLGPILILNPLFTKKILNLLNIKNVKLQYEENILKSYYIRLKEFESSNIKFS